MKQVLALLGGGHDLDVLKGAVCRVVVSVATGNAGAVAHGDRAGGQLRQALVLAVHRQLVCKVQQQTLHPSHDPQRYRNEKSFLRGIPIQPIGLPLGLQPRNRFRSAVIEDVANHELWSEYPLHVLIVSNYLSVK